ncbi:exopolysaccharide biosynthesis protein [Sporomusaceae bacterium BoRhaA]|nr:exopolysaccharide biosynthesis protein [Pelorhabdus rhamnosifermentans]
MFIATSPFIVLYGPFNNIKSTVIGAIMTSMHPQYITWLLSNEEIKSIIGDKDNNGQNRQNLFQIDKRHDESVKMINIKGGRFQGYLIEISDPSLIKVATARNIQEKGETISNIGASNNALAAINAGGFYDPNGTGTGRLPYGVILHNGQFLIGADINEPVPLIGFTQSGVLVAGDYTPTEMRNMHVREGVTFGPPLIVNGKKLITSGDGGWGVAPRTAIGQRKDGTVLLLAIDGRQPTSLGATLMDVQNILYEQGAYVAANLDGGSSTTMYYNGKVVNKPCDILGERMLPTAFIVQQ